MLTRKNLIILGAVLAVLVLASLAQQMSHRSRTSRPSSTTLIDGEYARADLGRVVVGRGRQAEAVVLTQDAAGWKVATSWNTPANPQRIDALLQGLSHLSGEFRSDRESVLPDYGFTDTTTVRVAGFDRGGKQVFDVELGKKPEGGNGNFVRRPGAREVYLTNADILGNLGVYVPGGRPQGRQFLDLQANKCEREDVDAITLHDGGKVVTMEKILETIQPAPGDTVHTEPFVDRASWEWQQTAPKRQALAKTKADGVLGAVCNLRAQDVADPSANPALYGLVDAPRRVVLKLAGGAARVIEFGGARAGSGNDPGGVYCRVQGQPAVWVVGDYQVKNIFKTPDELKPGD